MNRSLEIMGCSPRTKSRLTITPSRVTVKVAPKHEWMLNTWVAAAAAIAGNLEFDRSLRSEFTLGWDGVWLETDSRPASPNRVAFLYGFNGELRRKIPDIH